MSRFGVLLHSASDFFFQKNSCFPFIYSHSQVSDLLSWEEKYGRIPDGAMVLAKSGWSRYYADEEKYIGAKNATIQDMTFPGISGGAANWLTSQRKISGVGTETLSIDQGNSTDFPSHQIFSRHSVIMIENVGVGIHQVPASGAVVMSMPIKNRGASGAPIRMAAVWGDSVKVFRDAAGGASYNAASWCLIVLVLALINMLV